MVIYFLMSQSYHISRLTAVPSLIKALVPSLESSFLHNYNPLRLLMLSGEVLSLQLWKELDRILPNTTILNLYGSTEVELTRAVHLGFLLQK